MAKTKARQPINDSDPEIAKKMGEAIVTLKEVQPIARELLQQIAQYNEEPMPEAVVYDALFKPSLPLAKIGNWRLCGDDGIRLISAQSGVGKSYFAHCMIREILQYNTRIKRVAILDTELTTTDIQKRLYSLQSNMGDNSNKIDFYSLLMLSLEQRLSILERVLNDSVHDIVVLDVVSDFVDNINDANNVQYLADAIKKSPKKVFCIMHENEGNDTTRANIARGMLGRQLIMRAVDTFSLKRNKDDDEGGVICTHMKARMSESHTQMLMQLDVVDIANSLWTTNQQAMESEGYTADDFKAVIPRLDEYVEPEKRGTIFGKYGNEFRESTPIIEQRLQDGISQADIVREIEATYKGKIGKETIKKWVQKVKNG